MLAMSCRASAAGGAKPVLFEFLRVSGAQHELHLPRTLRFGPELAEAANKLLWLRWRALRCEAMSKIHGVGCFDPESMPQIQKIKKSPLIVAGGPVASAQSEGWTQIISRTNRGAVHDAIRRRVADPGVQISMMEIGTAAKSRIEVLLALCAVFCGEEIDDDYHPTVVAAFSEFKTWSALAQWCRVSAGETESGDILCLLELLSIEDADARGTTANSITICANIELFDKEFVGDVLLVEAFAKSHASYLDEARQRQRVTELTKILERLHDDAFSTAEVTSPLDTSTEERQKYRYITAAACKGKEFDSVELCDDFPRWRVDVETPQLPKGADEFGCLYVAATRARYQLKLPSWMEPLTSMQFDDYGDLVMVEPSEDSPIAAAVESTQQLASHSKSAVNTTDRSGLGSGSPVGEVAPGTKRLRNRPQVSSPRRRDRSDVDVIVIDDSDDDDCQPVSAKRRLESQPAAF